MLSPTRSSNIAIVRGRYVASAGGYANFHLPRTAVRGGHLVVGEQAGFQDALAGFGMRYALRSGVLAARSIIEGLDYAELWRRELLRVLEAGIANRFIFNSIGNRGSRWVLEHWLQGVDARKALRRLCGASSWTRLLFPIARWRYRGPLRDKSCDHVACACVWCRCATEEAAALARQKEGLAHVHGLDACQAVRTG
jgi:flavin-dependent dehydrogenase